MWTQWDLMPAPTGYEYEMEHFTIVESGFPLKA